MWPPWEKISRQPCGFCTVYPLDRGRYALPTVTQLQNLKNEMDLKKNCNSDYEVLQLSCPVAGLLARMESGHFAVWSNMFKAISGIDPILQSNVVSILSRVNVSRSIWDYPPFKEQATYILYISLFISTFLFYFYSFHKFPIKSYMYIIK